jgi:hypothetical protein
MNEFLAFANGLPNYYRDGYDDTIKRSNHGVFHLHRLDYNQLSTRGNDLTSHNLYRNNGADKG